MEIQIIQVDRDGVHHVVRADGAEFTVAGDDPERDAKIAAFARAGDQAIDQVGG